MKSMGHEDHHFFCSEQEYISSEECFFHLKFPTSCICTFKQASQILSKTGIGCTQKKLIHKMKPDERWFTQDRKDSGHSRKCVPGPRMTVVTRKAT